jgi:phospholipid/cholesterol/gamma-HCH transport system permease protein
MNPTPTTPAAIARTTPQELALSGAWTARGIGQIDGQIKALSAPSGSLIVVDAANIEAFDTAGAWIVQQLRHRLANESVRIEIRQLRPEFARLLEVVDQEITRQAGATKPDSGAPPGWLASLGYSTVAAYGQGIALLGFIGECTFAFGNCLAHPKRLRWRPILYNIRSAGFDALPIVGLLAFLLGIVVAYQGADQLRQYGANIFVADLVGLSMLREFAPLITAIIVAGRSGSAYAAQIGTMAVTEEIDAMRTIGIAPIELLVLPKIFAMLIALPLLTVFADILGVFGGMLMARAQLAVSYVEFMDRFVKTVSVTSYLIGVGKAPVFALIIVTIGCFQGFRTHGGADSVGRQTTRSVVQSIFLVIVADALFSVAFSALDL